MLPEHSTDRAFIVYPTEINSLIMRTKGATVGTATNWIFNFMAVEITPIGIENLGWSFYIIWIALNAAMVPAIYIFYPETAGRCLEDMDDYYRANPTLFAFLDTEAISSQRLEKYRIKDNRLSEAKITLESPLRKREGIKMISPSIMKMWRG